MPRKNTPKCYAASEMWIDPAFCGSSVGYRIYRGYNNYFCADVRLTDCHKQILWEFGGNERESLASNLKKLDVVVAMLQSFRQALIAQHNLHARRRRKRK